MPRQSQYGQFSLNRSFYLAVLAEIISRATATLAAAHFEHPNMALEALQGVARHPL
jgi:hypothetical protein